MLVTGLLVWRLHVTVGPTLVLGAALAYARSFFDGSEKKTGRPWDGFRVSRLWRLLHVRIHRSRAIFCRSVPSLTLRFATFSSLYDLCGPGSQSYFPLRAIRTTPLDASRQYIFGWHPHGILVLSRIFCYGGVWEHLFPNLDFRVLGATPMFFVPFCRDICLVRSPLRCLRLLAPA